MVLSAPAMSPLRVSAVLAAPIAAPHYITPLQIPTAAYSSLHHLHPISTHRDTRLRVSCDRALASLRAPAGPRASGSTRSSGRSASSSSASMSILRYAYSFDMSVVSIGCEREEMQMADGLLLDACGRGLSMTELAALVMWVEGISFSWRT